MTLTGLLTRSAERHGSKAALCAKRDGEWRGTTYDELVDISQSLAASLVGETFEPGDRVIIYAESQPEWVIAYFGAVAAGMSVVPLDPQTSGVEARAIADFTDARLLIASHLTVRELVFPDGDPFPIPVWNLADVTRSSDRGDSGIIDRASPHDPASIIFTAGTTVDPKGVVLTHANFTHNVWAISQLLPPQEPDRFLSVLPLNHAFEFTSGLLVPLSVGATVYYAGSLNPRRILATLDEVDASVMLGMPRLYRMCYQSVRRRAENEQRDPTDILRSLFGDHLRVLVSGGAALDPDVYADFEAAGVPIHEGYGLTETAPVLTVNPHGQTRRGSVGKPLPGVEIKIDGRDEDGIGEIVARCPSLMQGYFRNEAATGKVVRDGWLHTGDLGYADGDGYIYITGRSKDVIVTGAGKNVYPNEVELLYKGLPHVRELCVVGVRDSQGHEEVHGVFVVPPDVIATPELRAELHLAMQDVAAKTPSYQRIQHVHCWARELPKTHSLQVKRDEVRAMIEADEDCVVVDLPKKVVEEWTVRGWDADLVHEIARLAGVEARAIDPQHDFDRDLHLDSLMKVELLAMLETHLGVALPEHIALKLRTVQDVIDYVAPYMGDDCEADIDGLEGHTVARDALPAREQDSHYLVRTLGRALLGDSFRAVLRVLYRTLFALRGTGMENLPSNESFIIAANHSSHLDGGAIISLLGRKARDLHILGAKDYFFDWPLKAWVVNTFLNVLPFDRHDNFLRSLGLSERAVRMGRSLLIFPEGTRSRTGEIAAFKPGLALLALELGVPVVPAYIHGSYQAMPPGRALPRPASLSVFFGAPVRMEEYLARRDHEPHYPLYREITSRVQQAVESLRDRVRGA